MSWPQFSAWLKKILDFDKYKLQSQISNNYKISELPCKDQVMSSILSWLMVGKIIGSFTFSFFRRSVHNFTKSNSQHYFNYTSFVNT